MFDDILRQISPSPQASIDPQCACLDEVPDAPLVC